MYENTGDGDKNGHFMFIKEMNILCYMMHLLSRFIRKSNGGLSSLGVDVK